MDRDFDELRILKREGFFGSIPPVMAILRGTTPQSSANFSTPFFTADRTYEVLGANERHEVAATDGSVDIVKVASGVAPSSGTTVLASALPLTGTANTNQTAIVSAVDGNKILNKDESLALNATGLLTSLQGETIAVFLKAI